MHFFKQKTAYEILCRCSGWGVHSVQVDDDVAVREARRRPYGRTSTLYGCLHAACLPAAAACCWLLLVELLELLHATVLLLLLPMAAARCCLPAMLAACSAAALGLESNLDVLATVAAPLCIRTVVQLYKVQQFRCYRSGPQASDGRVRRNRDRPTAESVCI
eukprot:COSAG06_NODE_25166_length_643_cov_1.134191_1_plen_162_part_00